MSRQLFTVAEVNAMLPNIRRAADLVQRGSEQLSELSGRLYANHRPPADTLVDAGYMVGLEKVMEGVELIGDLGGEIKDLGRGLIDFPSSYLGRRVLLCWKPGEQEFRFWHDPDAGFSGRSPIENENDFEGEIAEDHRAGVEDEVDDSGLL
ncbi:MAG: DUF2203 family protein [Acidobacteria bacterium]|nr:MAG: DUF2203 family protein [Acidobacteriota bacterium]